MGMVHALKKGEIDPKDVSKDVKDAAKSMKKKDAKDYASTKHKGLPTKVKKEMNESLQLPLQAVVGDLLPGDMFSVRDDKERAELRKTLTDLKNTLNQFYKKNGIRMVVK